ncbi:hypothetical protein GPJ56_005700 [Histomonas meleagridis]|uniref:uncharacterized protein n=1 Tax=Histomonas meleagridis TaxID=135588 RepID=UPI00355A8644|nr:hypothetical protein GPJ56_005700 [Histomonas meleagridis]KAH0803365.1 hypothetical protein GO595_003709 [Histomonas meleagridis]
MGIELENIPFFAQTGKFRVLLVPVGDKHSSTFGTVFTILDKLCNTLELDAQTITPTVFNFKGTVPFSLTKCKSLTYLPFLLRLTDPLMPHLDYHVVIGTTQADTIDEALSLHAMFDKIVRETETSATPFLFVFTTSDFDEDQLPLNIIQISNNKDTDITRRIREGFVRYVTDYLMKLEPFCDDLKNSKDQSPSLFQLGSYAYMLGGVDEASQYFSSSMKHKPPPIVTAASFEVFQSVGIKFEIEKSFYEKEFSLLKDDSTQLPPEAISSLVYSSRLPDKTAYVRCLLRNSYRYPKVSRTLLLKSLELLKDKNQSQYISLTLLLLKHTGNVRTFIFRCSKAMKQGFQMPDFLLQEYVKSITEGNDWCEQRIVPATELFVSQSVPRHIKNQLLEYLLKYLHVIHERQQKLILSLIPTNVDIPATLLMNVNELTFLPQIYPVQEAKFRRSNVFIYSPLEKKTISTICSSGDELSFSLTLYNPLLIPLTFDKISLKATNSISYPTILTIPSKKTITTTLILKACEIGEIVLEGFVYIIGNINGSYKLQTPLTFPIVEQIPILTFKQITQFKSEIIENSILKFNFEVINPSNKSIEIKNIKFSAIPSVLTSTSLPIEYPPLIKPSLPDVIQYNETYPFSIIFNSDETNSLLSFAIDYGNELYFRRFELNQQFIIKSGPKIKLIKDISLDDHDDFDSGTINLMFIIENPLDEPIIISSNITNEKTFIKANEIGSLILQVKRFEIDIDSNTTNFECEGLDRSHIRKCEANAVKEKNSPLTKDDNDFLLFLLNQSRSKDVPCIQFEESTGEHRFFDILSLQNISSKNFTTLLNCLQSISGPPEIKDVQITKKMILQESIRKFLAAHEYIAPGGGLSPWGRAVLVANSENDDPTILFIELIRAEIIDVNLSSQSNGSVGITDIIERTFSLFQIKTEIPEELEKNSKLGNFEITSGLIYSSIRALLHMIVCGTYLYYTKEPSVSELMDIINDAPFKSFKPLKTGTLMRFLLESSEETVCEFLDKWEIPRKQLKKDVLSAVKWWGNINRATEELKQRSLRPNSRVSNLKNFLVLFECANQFVEKRSAKVLKYL